MSCCTRCGPAVYAAGIRGFALGHPDNSTLGLQQFPLEGHEGRRVCEQWDWKHLEVGGERSFGILQDGSLWGWGKAPLGDGTLEDSECPVFIHAGPWRLARDGYAINEDGELWLICGECGLEPEGQVQNAAALAYLSSRVASVSVTRGGNYSVPPIVRAIISEATQLATGHSVSTQASLKSVISLPVIDIVVTNGGGDYSTPPDVWLENSRGERVPCDAVIKDGVIVGVIARYQGAFEYARGDDLNDITPLAYFSYGSASAVVTLGEGPVVRVDVESGGSAYTTVPDVVFERDANDTANPFANGWPTTTEAVAFASLAPSAVDRIGLDPDSDRNRNNYPAAKVGKIVTWATTWPTALDVFSEGKVTGFFTPPEGLGGFKEGPEGVSVSLTGTGSGASVVVGAQTSNAEGSVVDVWNAGNAILGAGSTSTSYSLTLVGDGGSGWKFPPHPRISLTRWNTQLVNGLDLEAYSEQQEWHLPALEIDGPPSEWVHTPSVLIDGVTTATAIMSTREDGGRFVSKITVGSSAPVYTTPPEVKISHYTLSPRPLSDFCQEFDGKTWKDVRAGFAIEESTGHIWHWGPPAKANSGSVYPHPFGGLVNADDPLGFVLGRGFVPSPSASVPPPDLGISRMAGLFYQSPRGGIVEQYWRTLTVPDFREVDAQACGYLDNPGGGVLFAPPISFERFCGSGNTGLAAMTESGRLYYIVAGQGIYCGPLNGGRLGETVYDLDGGEGYALNFFGYPTAKPEFKVACLVKPVVPFNGMSVEHDGVFGSNRGTITSVRLFGGYGFPDGQDIEVTFVPASMGLPGTGASGVVRTLEQTPIDVVISPSSLWLCRGLDEKWYSTQWLAYFHSPANFAGTLSPREDLDDTFAGIESASDTVCRRVDGRLTSALAVDAPQYHIGGIEAAVTDTGSGYTLPASTLLPVQAAGIAAASVKPEQMKGKVYAVCVLDGGSGYEEPPSVTIGGNAEVACAILGPVVEVAVTNPGSGYTSPPRVIFSGTGIPASATCIMNSNGGVSAVSVTYGGEYRIEPAVLFASVDGNGSGAAATCRINGSIIYAEVIDPGSDYDQTPAVTVSGNGRLAARVLYDYESPDFDENPPTRLWPAFSPEGLPSTIAYAGQSKSPFGNSSAQDSGVCIHATASRNSDGSYAPISGLASPSSLKFYSQPSVIMGGNTFLVPTTELAVAGVAFSRTYKNEFFPQQTGLGQFHAPAVSSRRAQQRPAGLVGDPLGSGALPPNAEVSLDIVMRGKFDGPGVAGPALSHNNVLWFLSFHEPELRLTQFSTPPTARIVDHVGSGPTATGNLNADGRLVSWSVSVPSYDQEFTSNFRWEFTIPARRAAASRLASAQAKVDDDSGAISSIEVLDGGDYPEDPEVLIDGDGQDATAVAVMARPIASFSEPPSWSEGLVIVGGLPIVSAASGHPLYQSQPRIFAYGGGRAVELRVAMGGYTVASIELTSRGSGYTNASVSVRCRERGPIVVLSRSIDSALAYRNIMREKWDIDFVKFNKPQSPIWRSIVNPDSVVGTGSEWSDRCMFVFYESGHVSEVRVCNDTSLGFPAFRTRWDQFPPAEQTLQLTGDAARAATVQVTRPVWSECYSEKAFTSAGASDYSQRTSHRCVMAKRSDGF